MSTFDRKIKMNNKDKEKRTSTMPFIIALAIMFLLSMALIYQNMGLEKELGSNIMNSNSKILKLQDQVAGNDIELNECYNDLSLSELEVLFLLNDGYVFRSINYEKLEDILLLNTIDENEYLVDDYTCVNFARELVSALLEEGYYSCVAYIEDDEVGHEIVSIMTNEGLVFVEPQGDTIFLPIEVGDDYWGREIIRVVNCM